MGRYAQPSESDVRLCLAQLRKGHSNSSARGLRFSRGARYSRVISPCYCTCYVQRRRIPWWRVTAMWRREKRLFIAPISCCSTHVLYHTFDFHCTQALLWLVYRVHSPMILAAKTDQVLHCCAAACLSEDAGGGGHAGKARRDSGHIRRTCAR